MISWSYLQNPFDNVTKRNMKRMLMMATDHFDKLKLVASTDSFIDNLYQNALPKYDAFKNVYNELQSVRNLYQMHTQEVESLIKELANEKIKQWDIQIQYNYDDNSSKYKALLPNGRAPFQKGAYELRISELATLYKTLNNFPNLSQTQTDVQAFYQLILETRTAQQGMEKKEASMMLELEQARFALAKAMHQIYGYLIGYYSDNLKTVETFYELKYLRVGSSTNSSEDESEAKPIATEQNKIEKLSTLEVFKDKVNEDDDVVFENLTSGMIELWTGENINDPKPKNTLLVSPGQSVNFTAKNFSNGTVKTLFVLNGNEEVAEFSAALYRDKTNT